MTNPEAKASAAARQRARYAADPEAHKASARSRYHATKAVRNPMRVLRRFGLTQADYDEILAAQAGHCAVCDATTGEGKRRLFVDHDHKTNRVRGLLCHRCNSALGLLDDNPTRIRALADYVAAEATLTKELAQ